MKARRTGRLAAIRQRARRRHRRVLFVAVLVLALLAAGGWFVFLRPAPSITVRVNGRSVTLNESATVRDALARARVPWPGDGRLLAVSTHRVLDAHWHPGTVRWNRRHLQRRSRVADHAHIVVRDGHDAVEGTRPIQGAVAPPGLPDIEYDLWDPGTAGVANDAIGVNSGEVVRQAVVKPPVPASRVPGKVLALSFDDGPNPQYTPAVLDILRRSGIKATFCVVGHYARLRPDLLQAERADGHLVCDHTENHAQLNKIPTDHIAGEVAGPAEYCRLVTGQKIGFMRPPYGGTNQAVIDTAHGQSLRVLNWSVDPQDWTRPGVAAIVTRVLKQAHPGAVVLMHDGGGDRSETVTALPIIIAALQAQGYGFVQPVST